MGNPELTVSKKDFNWTGQEVEIANGHCFSLCFKAGNLELGDDEYVGEAGVRESFLPLPA